MRILTVFTSLSVKSILAAVVMATMLTGCVVVERPYHDHGRYHDYYRDHYRGYSCRHCD